MGVAGEISWGAERESGKASISLPSVFFKQQQPLSAEELGGA